MSRYYFWTIQCAAGESTQNAVSLSQQGCQEIQQLYAPNDPDAFYGFGWAVSEVSDGAGGTTKMLSHAGSNNLWIVYVSAIAAVTAVMLLCSLSVVVFHCVLLMRLYECLMCLPSLGERVSFSRYNSLGRQ